MDEQPKSSSNYIGWIVGVVVVVAVIILLSGKGGKGPASTLPPGNEVAIGSVLPLSGDAVTYGQPIQRAMEMAVEEINAKGGVAGKQLKIKYEDGKCDGKEGATAGQKLINVDKVKIILGGACSGETLGFTPIAETAKVVVISPTASSPDVTNAGDYIFRVYPSDALAGKVAASYAYEKLSGRKAALITENTAYAQGLRKTFQDSFVRRGGEVVVDEVYNTGETNFRTQILKVKKSGADFLYLVPQSDAPGLLIAKQLRESGSIIQLLTAEVLLNRDVVAKAPRAFEAMIGFEPAFDEASEATAKFLAAYKAKFNEDAPLPFFMANGYSEVFLAKDMIEKHGFDTVAIQKDLAGLTNWSGGVLTGLTFDQYGDPIWSKFSVKQAKDGKLEALEVFEVK